MTCRVIGVVLIAVSSVTVRTTLTLAAGPEAWAGDLSPIAASEWNADRAAHLIERAGFGAAPDEVARLAALTPQQAVDELVDYESIVNDLKSKARSRGR
jgi:hypothetical protein